MIGIIGAGAMGSALGIHLARNGRDIAFLATEYDGAVVDAYAKGEPHPALGLEMPNVPMLEPDAWDSALGILEMAVLAVSTAGLVTTVARVAPALKPDCCFVVATKGWDAATLRPAAQIVADETSEDRVVALVGPSLAKELAMGTPTALVCASRSLDAAGTVARAFAGPTMRTFVSDDVTGVEVGAILKNIIAIAIGIVDGVSEAQLERGPMLNTRSFIFARGLIEMATLSEALGGKSETVLGLTGAGDLFVTALGGRNGRFGRLVGIGLDPEEALVQMATTVEGVANAATAVKLAGTHGLELPLCSAVARILDGADPWGTLAELFDGEVGPER